MGYPEELAELQRRRVADATLALVNGGKSAHEDLAAALDDLATGVADEAALWEKYKKKGWQSTKRELHTVAGKLRDLAREMDKHAADAAPAKRGIEPGGDPNQPGTAERGDPDKFVYRDNGQPAPAERDAALHEAPQWPREADGSPAPGTPEDMAAVAPVSPSPQTMAYLAGQTDSPDAPLPTTEETPIIDTVHGEARQMLEERRTEAAADPFTDPLPPSNPLADIEPITFGQLMIGQSAPAELTHWSYSQLSDMDECEVKYAARKIFGKPSLPQWSLVGGSALHSAIDIIERRILAPGSAPENWGSVPEIWATAFQSAIDERVNESRILPQDWRAANSGKENYDWWRVEGEGMLTVYVANRIKLIEAATRAGIAPRRLFTLTTNQHGVLPNDQSTAPVLELELSINVPGPMGNLQFKSILDQAWLCPDGTLLIVDIKSGRQMPSAFDTFQLGTQAMVLAQHIGIQPPAPFLKACYYDARRGVYTDPINALERHPFEELVYRMHTAEMRRQTGIYRPNVTTRGCTGCGVRKLCPMMGGK